MFLRCKHRVLVLRCASAGAGQTATRRLRPALNKWATPRFGCCLATLTLSNAGTQQHPHLTFLAAAARSNKLDLGLLPTDINVFKLLAVIKKRLYNSYIHIFKGGSMKTHLSKELITAKDKNMI